MIDTRRDRTSPSGRRVIIVCFMSRRRIIDNVIRTFTNSVA